MSQQVTGSGEQYTISLHALFGEHERCNAHDHSFVTLSDHQCILTIVLLMS